MKPREAGGVVDSKLNVYGVQGLKVADLSIPPSNVAAVSFSFLMNACLQSACSHPFCRTPIRRLWSSVKKLLSSSLRNLAFLVYERCTVLYLLEGLVGFRKEFL